MNKVLVSLFVFLTLTITQALAYNVKDFSSDAKILAAMQLLEQNGETQVFANLKKNAVKVKFQNLSFNNVYAANAYDNYGRRVILINSMYQNAPVEQIACLIAHESCHLLKTATLAEETTATTKEAQCWTKLKNNSTTYPDTKLTKRLDKIAGLYVASENDGSNYLQDKIASSSFYRTQLKG